MHLNTVIKISITSLIINVFTTDAMTANPIISRGKPVFTSDGEVRYLTDNKFGNQFWPVKNGSWVAINTGEGPRKVFLNFNDPAYAWAKAPIAPPNCPNDQLVYLRDYDILTSSNSTNGSNGDWNKVLSIKGNVVTARGHEIEYAGASWVKIQILDGGGNLDEVEIFDVTKGSEDIWFFAGTSISANTYKGNPPEENFADLIAKNNPGFNPVMIRGGIGCQNSTQLVQNIKTYLEIASNANFWAIEHGTNDAWGGTNGGVSTFKNNLQIVIDSCKKNGIKPVIARMIANNKTAAGWQVHQDYLKCIDELTTTNNLIPGPDLYSWFSEHPEGLNSDGVHPNAKGAEKIQQLWALKMDSLYKSAVYNKERSNLQSKSRLFTMQIKNRQILIHSSCSGEISIFSSAGHLLKRTALLNSKASLKMESTGVFVVKFVHSKGMETVKFVYNSTN